MVDTHCQACLRNENYLLSLPLARPFLLGGQEGAPRSSCLESHDSLQQSLAPALPPVWTGDSRGHRLAPGCPLPDSAATENFPGKHISLIT